MIAKTHTLRARLLIGASIGAMLFTGVAEAQSGRGRGGGAASGADAAVRAAQAQASQQAAQASSASQRAVAAFRRAADGRAAMQSAQAAARAAAQAAQANVPNGLGQGGLQVADGVTVDPSLWIGANGPTQTTGADGRTQVSIDQTQQKAILTWDSFNIGRETDLSFNQQGADWVALNRVTDVNADPTKILGSIKAQGSVYIINRNGVIFGGASQVNVRNLIASSAGITNDQFLDRGIYSSLSGSSYVPSFTDAGGKVTVEAGARITTNTPTSVTAGGGFVLLMGTE
ncbi:filamentous hemagglutinin N-terminal domain-containing protein, partial [Brevundimonas sp.]|uniref:two-partner secretion domain-containing protein n=2 Tax=Brevundimonas TaxID=41275 RepID=UPI0028B08B85